MFTYDSQRMVKLGFSLVILKYIFALTAIHIPRFIDYGLVIIGLVVLIPYILRNTYEKKELIVFFIEILFGLYILFLSREFLVLVIAFVSLAMKNINYKEIINVYAFIISVFFVGTIVYSFQL